MLRPLWYYLCKMKIQMTEKQFDAMRTGLIMAKIEMEFSLSQLKFAKLDYVAEGVQKNLDKVNHALDTTSIWDVETL